MDVVSPEAGPEWSQNMPWYPPLLAILPFLLHPQIQQREFYAEVDSSCSNDPSGHRQAQGKRFV